MNTEKIIELKTQIKELKEKCWRLECEDAAELCPFRIGQVLINKKGRKARVSTIHPNYSGYECHGIRILKDGSDGADIIMYEWDEWKLPT